MNENNRRGGKGVCYSRAMEGHRHGNPSTSSTNRDEFNPQRVFFFSRAKHIENDTESLELVHQCNKTFISPQRRVRGRYVRYYRMINTVKAN